MRSARQLLYSAGGQPPAIQSAWMLRDGNNCVTAKGHIGTCTTYRSCYPYFKIPDLTIWESWILGNYDTCSFFNDDGRQTFGVCCSNPISAPVAAEANGDRGEAGVDIQTSTTTSTTTTTPVKETGQKDNNYPNWPPPVPTHPPDHAAPTHPTSAGSAQVTTARPTSSTTWPTKATQAPTVAQWPPSVPTHAPPVSGAVNINNTTETAIDNNEIDVQFATCGAKNGNPVRLLMSVLEFGSIFVCSLQDQERIVGGQNADPNEWPWVVVIFNSGRQLCGGSLIDESHILTAAHCVAQ